MEPYRFTVTDQHLRLLSRAYTSWDDCEYGAPEIDPKRPYGNSDVLGDMREILPGVSDEDLERLHRETGTVLEIGLRTGAFVLGEYEAERYTAEWRRVDGGEETGRLSDSQVRELVESALRLARPPMGKYLGLDPRGYDAADEIAGAINQGIRAGLTHLGLIEEHDDE